MSELGDLGAVGAVPKSGKGDASRRVLLRELAGEMLREARLPPLGLAGGVKQGVSPSWDSPLTSATSESPM